MRRSFASSLSVIGIGLGLIGTLFAYANPDLTSSPAVLTADGLLTPRTRAVISGEFAYLLGTPEVVAADARIEKLASSSTGDAVLIGAYKRRPFRGIALSPAQTEPSVGEFNLIYWDTRTRTSKTLLREAVNENAMVVIEEIAWLPQTYSALVVLGRANLKNGKPEAVSRSLLRVETAAGTVRRIADFPVSESLEVSPSEPLAYVLTNEDTKSKTGPVFRSSIRAYTPQGFRAPISLPDGAFGLTWMSDGKSVYADRIVERDAEGKIKSRKVLTLVNLETGEVTQPEKLPVIPITAKSKVNPPQRESWAVSVTSSSAALQNPEGKSQPASALWLRAADVTKTGAVPTKSGDGPVATDSLLIAANARLETELATENAAAILFTRDGSLCAAPVFRLPAQAFEDALRGIQRTATMSNAKQVGLAIMMYTQDYDQNLPLPGDGVKDVTGPYLKSPSVFNNPGTGENGFVYSYQGPANFGQIGQPGTTKLGHIAGPGGRAIIWADGHITWEDTP